MADAGSRDVDSALSSCQEPDVETQAVSAAQRSLMLIEHVAMASSPPTLMDIATALHLPKATAFRLCSQLVSQRWLVRDQERVYRSGPRLHGLCRNVLQMDRLKAQRHQILSRLVERLGETCNLTVLDGNRVLYLDRVETHWPLRMVLDAGSHVPIHATASGKLFLAWMDESARREMLLNLDLAALTPHTLISIEDIEQESVLIRDRGYATDREEFLSGLIAVAAPIFDDEGRCRAAVAVHAPVARMSLEKAIEALPLLKSAAREMSTLI